MMKQRRLGNLDRPVSAIGIGGMSFSNFYGKTSEEASHAILSAALDEGVTHIDTANVYGMGGSERAIGSFLARQGSQAKDLFSIATKAGITRDPETGKRCFNNSIEHLEAELDQSLERLGVDYVDLFYVHRREAERPIEEVTEGLASLIKKGKIGGFGYSEIAPSSLRRAQVVHPVTAVQSEYSLAVRSPELGLTQTTAELDVALVAFGPVGRAFLTDTPHTEESVKGLAWLEDNPRFQPDAIRRNTEASAGFRALAADMGTSAAALAIAWLLHQGDNVIPIPGTRSVEHFKQICDGARMTLTPEQITAIENTLPLGWAHGDRYSVDQWIGPERYC